MGIWINWVIENKEWLFSGLGLSVLGGLYFLVRWLLRRKAKTTDQVKLKTQTEENKAEDRRPVTRLDFNKIKNEIKSLPPYQREHVLKNYIGLRVEYTGPLHSVDQRDNDRIAFYLGDTSDYLFLVTGVLEEKEFPEFKVMHEGTMVTLRGDIIELSEIKMVLGNIELIRNMLK